MSAGVRACHQLCDELRKRGFDAAIRSTHGAWQPSPYNAPPVQILTQQQINESICIFPEYIIETDVKTPRAIKWWLQKPKKRLAIKGPIWVWSKGMGNYPRLMLNVLDTELFKPMNMSRVTTGYYVGKGKKDSRFIPEGAIEISRAFPQQRHELANLLAQLDHLVCFDGYSALACEAALMGTPVLMPNVSKELRKMNEQHEFKIGVENGFAYSQEEMPMARANAGRFYEFYKEIEPMFDDDLDLFADTLESQW